MNDLMIDLETFGLVPGCAIRSIGAVMFDLATGETGEEFYVNVDLASCLALDLYVDPQTKGWWDQQAKAAQEVLNVDPKPLREAIESFRKWVITHGGQKGDLCVWSHGLSFDVPIIIYISSLLRLRPVWNYWNERDTRTMIALSEEFDLDAIEDIKAKFDGTEHHALHDAKHQVKVLSSAYNIITRPRPIPLVDIPKKPLVLIDEKDCPGHVASDDDPKVCRYCGVHIDSLRPLEDEITNAKTEDTPAQAADAGDGLAPAKPGEPA